MFIDPSYSGTGIGSKIIEQLENDAKAYGFSKGTLSATLSGLAFYKTKGWKSIAQEQLILANGVSLV
jgi:GNAT superfamily N-acetyltransferase